jgi:glycosyltransferase involved in cell wall biosynthesis
MKVAYLTSRYPKISHTFIRREIAEIEARGIEVDRISVRRADEPLVDPADVAEGERTFVLLSVGGVGLVTALFAVLVARPAAWVRALRATWRMGRRSQRGMLTHFAYLAEACVLVRRFARSGVEHLHAHFGDNPAAVALLVSELGGPSFSFTSHGTGSFADPLSVALPFKLERCAFAVAVCEFGRSQHMRWSAPEHWPRMHVVRCGLDRAFLAAEPTPVPEVPRFVAVARFGPEKGLPVLLDALGALKSEGRAFELVLVGDGPLRGALGSQARALGIEGSVRFAGWKSNADVQSEVRASRALVLPSFSEGLPIVILEALALGRPVVATAVGGVPEIALPGRTGWLVPPGSVDALAGALREVLDADSRHLSELGQNGAALVREKHDAAVEAGRLAALFERALPGTRRGA